MSRSVVFSIEWYELIMFGELEKIEEEAVLLCLKGQFRHFLRGEGAEKSALGGQIHCLHWPGTTCSLDQTSV
jgi:hypothetical protein